MSEPKPTIDLILGQQYETFTRAERQLANTMMENYPVSALGSVTTLADASGVSTPTVVRMVQKLGYHSFPEFQADIRREIEAKISDPIAKRDTWAGNAPDEHVLNKFTEVVIGNIRQSLAQIEPEDFDACCKLLSDTNRKIFVVGGRITRTLADYFFLHFQVIRPSVTLIHSISNAWPHYLLDMAPDDVVVVFDVRRYENSTLKLAEMAKERGAKLVLFTDQWRAPISKIADHCFSCSIAVPSAWDSSVVSLLLVETIIAEVQERNWDSTRTRVSSLESMFDQTRLFRKFT